MGLIRYARAAAGYGRVAIWPSFMVVGTERPSYSHFNAMAYWHTGVPHRGDEFGWMGRVADQIAHRRQDDLLINIGSQQSLAVKSARHTPAGI